MNTQQIMQPIAGDFEEWYWGHYGYITLDNFYDLHEDKQLGVLLRYFRERWGIEITIFPFNDGLYGYSIYQKKQRLVDIQDHSVSIFEFLGAFSEALTKAVELVKGRQQ